MPAEPTATSPGRIATCEPPETTFPWPPQSHPLAVFLSDVLEGLLGEDTVRLDIAAAPETHGLAMEKLFCFSQALHLLLLPLPVARESPGHGRGPADALPVLRVRLTQREDRRYSLHLYDDGRFFRRRFPELRLDAEWLRPLLLFVAKRQGSLLIKQGRAVAFEIIC